MNNQSRTINVGALCLLLSIGQWASAQSTSAWVLPSTSESTSGSANTPANAPTETFPYHRPSLSILENQSDDLLLSPANQNSELKTDLTGNGDLPIPSRPALAVTPHEEIPPPFPETFSAGQIPEVMSQQVVPNGAQGSHTMPQSRSMRRSMRHLSRPVRLQLEHFRMLHRLRAAWVRRREDMRTQVVLRMVGPARATAQAH